MLIKIHKEIGVHLIFNAPFEVKKKKKNLYSLKSQEIPEEKAADKRLHTPKQIPVLAYSSNVQAFLFFRAS